jgi:hypothetical protein
VNHPYVFIPIAVVGFISFIWIMVWFESEDPPHSHDEGDHDPRCPGCFAEQVRR